jgi:hypothetical protein
VHSKLRRRGEAQDEPERSHCRNGNQPLEFGAPTDRPLPNYMTIERFEIYARRSSGDTGRAQWLRPDEAMRTICSRLRPVASR